MQCSSYLKTRLPVPLVTFSLLRVSRNSIRTSWHHFILQNWDMLQCTGRILNHPLAILNRIYITVNAKYDTVHIGPHIGWVCDRFMVGNDYNYYDATIVDSLFDKRYLDLQTAEQYKGWAREYPVPKRYTCIIGGYLHYINITLLEKIRLFTVVEKCLHFFDCLLNHALRSTIPVSITL